MLGTSAVSKLLANVTDQSSLENGFKQAVIQRFFAAKLSDGISPEEATRTLSVPTGQLSSRLEAPRALLKIVRRWCEEATLPRSLAREYLHTFSERQAESLKYQDRSAPDAAFDGPRLISGAWINDEQKLSLIHISEPTRPY